MEKKSGWKRFQKIKLSSRSLSSRAKKAETATTRHAHRFVLSRLKNLSDSRQAILSWLALVGLIIAAAAGQLAVAVKEMSTKSPVEGGTYSEGLVGEIATLNPLFATNSAELAASKLIYSSLYDYDSTGSIRDDLASKLTVSKDKTEYDIELRSDALWHDGKPVTVDDVIYTVESMKNPAVRATQASTWRGIDVSKVSQKVVRFKLPAAYASFLHALTFPVLPAHLLEKLPQDAIRQNTFSASPIGSGPFQVKLLQSQNIPRKQKVVYLAANSNYYRGVPKLKRFEIHAYSSRDDLKSALETSDIIAAVDEGADIASQLPDRFAVHNQPISSGVYAIFNNSSGILRDVRVRKALQLGTDTKKVLEALDIKGLELDSPILKSQLQGVKLSSKPSYNVSLARKLLDRSGWRQDGDTRIKNKKVLSLKMALIKDSRYEAAYKELARQWRELGVEVDATVFDSTKTTQSFAQTTLQSRSYDVLINELVLGADPDVYPYWHSSQAGALGLNLSNYKNDVADYNLATARSAVDVKVRNEKYGRFVKQWMSDAPAVALYQSSMSYVTAPSARPSIKDTVTPMMSDRFSDVLYWTADRSNVYTTP